MTLFNPLVSLGLLQANEHIAKGKLFLFRPDPDEPACLLLERFHVANLLQNERHLFSLDPSVSIDLVMTLMGVKEYVKIRFSIGDTAEGSVLTWKQEIQCLLKNKNMAVVESVLFSRGNCGILMDGDEEAEIEEKRKS